MGGSNGKPNAFSRSMADNTVSNQSRLPDTGICRTRHLEHSLEFSVCLVKDPYDCEHVRRVGSGIFCHHPDRRSFEATGRV